MCFYILCHLGDEEWSEEAGNLGEGVGDPKQDPRVGAGLQMVIIDLMMIDWLSGYIIDIFKLMTDNGDYLNCYDNQTPVLSGRSRSLQ